MIDGTPGEECDSGNAYMSLPVESLLIHELGRKGEKCCGVLKSRMATILGGILTCVDSLSASKGGGVTESLQLIYVRASQLGV